MTSILGRFAEVISGLISIQMDLAVGLWSRNQPANALGGWTMRASRGRPKAASCEGMMNEGPRGTGCSRAIVPYLSDMSLLTLMAINQFFD